LIAIFVFMICQTNNNVTNFKMQTRNQKVEQNHSLEKADQKGLVPPYHFLKSGAKSLAPPYHFLKSGAKSLAPPFPKVDFDESSKAWKANKKSIGNGCYKYICIKITKNGKQCKNDSLRGCEYCKFHVNK